MDLSKIKTLIDFVGQSTITELTVTEKDTTVRIFRTGSASVPDARSTQEPVVPARPAPSQDKVSHPVRSPIFGVLHVAAAPGEDAFVKLGDTVEAGQTLFIVEAMKVFNAIPAQRAGRIVRIVAIDGDEVEADDVLAEIA